MSVQQVVVKRWEVRLDKAVGLKDRIECTDRRDAEELARSLSYESVLSNVRIVAIVGEP
jgi:hypothetical protein